MKNGKTAIAISLAVIILLGHAMLSTPKAYPFLKNEVSVVGNTIYCNGKPYAELRFFDTNIAEVLTQSTWVDGIAMYYYQNDKEIWIYPKEGLSIRQYGKEYHKIYHEINDMKRVWGKFLLDHAAVQKGEMSELSWASMYVGQRLARKEDSRVGMVRISDDGKYVYYKTSGIFFESSHKYRVE